MALPWEGGALPARGIIPVVPSANDPPINNMGCTVRRHFTDDANLRVGLSTPGHHMPVDSGHGKVHFAEVRGREKKPEGQKYIGETRCDKEFANKQKRHLVSTNRGEGPSLTIDRKAATYVNMPQTRIHPLRVVGSDRSDPVLEGAQLMKNAQRPRDREVEKQMGMKKKVVSARNGIPYMQGGDKSYPSPEYAPDFYKDYSVSSSAAWATSVAREARADPTRHAVEDHGPKPQRMTWKLRKALENFEGELDDVKGLDDWQPAAAAAVADAPEDA